MNARDPNEIAATVLWEYYGNHDAAIAYCQRILSPIYTQAAQVLARQKETKAAQQNESRY